METKQKIVLVLFESPWITNRLVLWELLDHERRPPMVLDLLKDTLLFHLQDGQDVLCTPCTLKTSITLYSVYKNSEATLKPSEVGAQIFFRQKKWQFFHQKWWFSRWITENGDNIGEGTGDIFSDCWKSWNSCHNYCHLFWWQYCHQIWWRFFHRKWWLSKWITVKGEKSGERKGDVLGEC